MDRALKASPTIPNTQVRKMSLYGFFEIRRHNVYKTMCQKSPLLKVINLLLNVLTCFSRVCGAGNNAPSPSKFDLPGVPYCF